MKNGRDIPEKLEAIPDEYRKNNYGYEEQKKILTIPFYMLFSFLNSLSKGEINIAEEQ